MKFDLVIANPPYGKIGAEVVSSVIKNIKFKDFVNLLPANDYKRNKDKNLFQFQSDMTAIDRDSGFTDAYVSTHLATIHNKKVNRLTIEEFERSQYLDRSLDKFFYINSKLSIKFKEEYKPNLETFKNCQSFNSIYINKRDVSNGHLAYTKKCNAYLWNHDLCDVDYILSHAAKSEQAKGRAGDFCLITFDTELEKTNVSNFLYSELGFKFMSKVMESLNTDSYISVSKYLPRVDWTKNWTVEEILVQYGYSTDEVHDILADLPKYRYLED